MGFWNQEVEGSLLEKELPIVSHCKWAIPSNPTKHATFGIGPGCPDSRS